MITLFQWQELGHVIPSKVKQNLAESIKEGIVFFLYFSVCLSSVYEKATDFCVLILCPANLMKVFISYRSFLVGFSGSLMYKTIFSVIRVL